MAGCMLPLAAMSLTAATAAHNPLLLNVAGDGSYGVALRSKSGGTPLPLLASAPLGVQHAGAWCGAGCLKLADQGAPPPADGQDQLGQFTRTAHRWLGPDGLAVETAFRTYADRPLIVFEAAFPTGLRNSSIPSGKVSGGVRIAASTSFPSWRADAKGHLLAGDELGTLSWGDLGNGEAGRWSSLSPGGKAPPSGGELDPAYKTQHPWGGGWACSQTAPNAPFGRGCQFDGTNLALFTRNQTLTLVSSALTGFDHVLQRR